MAKKKHWYKVHVKCKSFETFGCVATSHANALKKFHEGDCQLEDDEVEDRTVDWVEQGQQYEE